MKLTEFIKDDIEKISDSTLSIEKLKDKTILVTGSTGLLGSMTCKTLSHIDKNSEMNLKIIAMVRSEKRAHDIFADVMSNGNIAFLEQDITEEIKYAEKVDYIIHTACPTASNTFISKPVETVQAIVCGTMNVLNFAKDVGCESVVYLSSMEAYGQVLHENLLKPEDVGYVNPLSLRSCYPEGKRMAENLCIGYFSEYGVPVKVIRLAQTFGPGIPESDGRVFAQFIRSVRNDEDIVMFTEGGSKRMYLDTMDAVGAVLAVLINGEDGQVYNAGNPNNYLSIKEMAELVLCEFGNGSSKLVIDKSKDVGQYPPDNMLYLDVEPLKALGWEPLYDLKAMYSRMINFE